MSGDQQTKSELVQVDELGKLRAMSVVDPRIDPGTWWTSLPQGTEKERAGLLRYRRRSERMSDDVIFQELTITDVYIHTVSIVNDTDGSVDEAVRVVLISPDGTSTQFVSGGILETLGEVISVFGSPPWSPPIIVKVCQESTRKKRRRLFLEPCGRVATEL